MRAVALLEFERALIPPRRTVAAVPEFGDAASVLEIAAHAEARAATAGVAVPAPARTAAAWGAARLPAKAGAVAAPARAADDEEPALVRALRAELAMRASAEAGLRARALDAETRLAARVLVSQRTAATLDQIRSELDQLATMLGDERARRETAELRVAELELAERRAAKLEAELATARRSDRADGELDADGELQSLRESLRELQAVPDLAPDTGAGVASVTTIDVSAGGMAVGAGAGGASATAVEPARLADALIRLRATSDPIAAASAPTSASSRAMPTLVDPFRRMCRADPSAAGRLVVSLLGLQATAYPRPVSYDILLGQGYGSLQVTSAGGEATIVQAGSARPRQQVEFQIVGTHARLAKLLVAGRLRRRLGLGVARVRGNRHGVDALDALLALPLDLPMLAAGGVASDADVLLSLIAAMVRPEWTRGERFAISHRDGRREPSYLLVADGRPVSVTRVPPVRSEGRIATTIACTGADLAMLLADRSELGPERLELHGDRGPLTELQGWVKRAQSE